MCLKFLTQENTKPMDQEMKNGKAIVSARVGIKAGLVVDPPSWSEATSQTIAVANNDAQMEATRVCRVNECTNRAMGAVMKSASIAGLSREQLRRNDSFRDASRASFSVRYRSTLSAHRIVDCNATSRCA